MNSNYQEAEQCQQNRRSGQGYQQNFGNSADKPESQNEYRNAELTRVMNTQDTRVVCHNCQMTGHFARDCMKPKVNLFGPQSVNFSDWLGP
ncbi:MAG: hypothetical protein GY696_26130 [Gammaproteobacteria bacterium]|nr:hypothetical protein [Gammaproteobacteria bacterium]